MDGCRPHRWVRKSSRAVLGWCRAGWAVGGAITMVPSHPSLWTARPTAAAAAAGAAAAAAAAATAAAAAAVAAACHTRVLRASGQRLFVLRVSPVPSSRVPVCSVCSVIIVILPTRPPRPGTDGT
jgi:hypothetical protein